MKINVFSLVEEKQEKIILHHCSHDFRIINHSIQKIIIVNITSIERESEGKEKLTIDTLAIVLELETLRHPYPKDLTSPATFFVLNIKTKQYTK
jgi:hypothetical protein